MINNKVNLKFNIKNKVIFIIQVAKITLFYRKKNKLSKRILKILTFARQDYKINFLK